MIVRIWEAQVVPARREEFCARLADEVIPALDGTDGYQGAELLRSVSALDHRVLVVTRWRDEAALRAYAGTMWRIRPVWAEGEFGFLEHPPSVAHFEHLPPAAEPAAPRP
ncbi:antibiotic biosynthesis monooxygenase family protein [Kitasatospora sp. NPDC096147]|uniref:antibiotic biosynthesis monooxygenase family protein n=1 Tax=Kitasatospora sp. NPDC096147 TaxID=3364093 RepID=UPI0038020EB1